MSESMETQRLNSIGERLLRITARLPDVHPDSPEAREIHAEAEKLQAEMTQLSKTFFIGKPWWFKPVIWCVGAFAQMTSPIVNFCFRLYHMVRGFL